MKASKLRLSQVTPVPPNGVNIIVQGITYESMEYIREAAKRIIPDLINHINNIDAEADKLEAEKNKVEILAKFKMAYGFDPMATDQKEPVEVKEIQTDAEKVGSGADASKVLADAANKLKKGKKNTPTEPPAKPVEPAKPLGQK